MPQGGSITLEMAPLLYFSYKYRYKWGITAGLVSGLLQAVFGGYVAHPAQGILDYPAAFACMGLAGCFGESAKGVTAGTALAVVSRLVCHVLSGVIFFASYAPEGQTPLDIFDRVQREFHGSVGDHRLGSGVGALEKISEKSGELTPN